MFIPSLRVIMEHERTHTRTHAKRRHFPEFSGYKRCHNNGTTFLATLSWAFPQEQFPPPHGCQPIWIFCALNLLNVDSQARKQHIPFSVIFQCHSVRLSRGLNHRHLKLAARTITPLSPVTFKNLPFSSTWTKY